MFNMLYWSLFVIVKKKKKAYNKENILVNYSTSEGIYTTSKMEFIKAVC